MEGPPRARGAEWALRVLGVGGGYLGLATLADEFSANGPVRPELGIGVAALALFGWGALPVLAAAALAHQVLLGERVGHALLLSAAILGELALVVIVLRLLEFRAGFRRVQDTLTFAGGTAVASALAAARTTPALVAIGALHGPELAMSTLLRGLSHLCGILLIGSPILAFAGQRDRPFPAPDRRLEAAALTVVTIAVGGSVFGLSGRSPLQATYWLLPLVVVAAIRHGARGAALFGALVGLFAALASVGGRGPFGELVERSSIVALQAYLLVLSATGLLLGAGADERQELSIARESLEDERRQLQLELFQAQKMEGLGRLAGGVAHDFNNLLTVILGYTEELLAHSAPAPRHRDMLLEIRRASERAAEMTRHLLAFSRRSAFAPRVVRLNELLRESDKMLRRLVGADVELELRLEPGLPKIRIDPGQLDQLLLNLVVNARDAMPGGGHLTIATGEAEVSEEIAARSGVKPGRHVALTVRDDGCGMTDEIRERAFEPFFTTKEPGRGTGLGLSTVYGIVHQSGGTIAIDSDPGIGTTFSVTFPAVERASSSDVVAVTVAGSGAGSETILLVEDERGVRDLATRVLVAAGYNVLAASDGEEALSLSNRHEGTIELLATDVVMPGVQGPRLAAELVARRPGIKILFLSGYAADALSEAKQIEAEVSFLQKPFSPLALRTRIRELLDGAEGEQLDGRAG